ncbi:DUF4391 domain-containing protein [Winogradskyella sp.]|uniref:DUF4391 domain-containing protein n=1 Tax=Winogradskyella sp. TaxID=1883156 RepID=UPI0035C79E9B
MNHYYNIIKNKNPKNFIEKLLEIIDKSIPYHIIFVLNFEDQVKIPVAQKHLHPTNENNAVIDWTFKSEWLNKDLIKYQLNLKGTLDSVIKDLCIQLSGKKEDVDLSLNELVAYMNLITLFIFALFQVLIKDLFYVKFHIFLINDFRFYPLFILHLKSDIGLNIN